ncbi:BZ3500_MvSof-1268-A1-R1_Chr1-3g02382 [Microbotryum saponariae]|uniref:BZ3500_MvSof-1268-A1-R1_Chr1-3g02382 protein n=1 Tax=Microbotryum saponariae TaxID=289078 RepID=A0A2X0KDB7_9BASI|nr:BZ3500_MvSof-1268-A1-R1_Chr1-3g02382 [Microbotryum saponariae]SCZ96169.1 BZ3501_MvSof-1269-A2-R1_Chr1-3g01985 [Microbotryum saponariae]
MPAPGRSAPASPRQPSRIPTRRSSASTPPSAAGSPTTPAAIAANPASIGSPSRPAPSSTSHGTLAHSTTNEAGRRAERSISVSQPHRLSHEASFEANMAPGTIDVISGSPHLSPSPPPETRERLGVSRSAQKYLSSSSSSPKSSQIREVEEGLRSPSSLVYPAPIRFPSHPSRPSSSTTTGQPRRSTCPVRPKLERPLSTCYTSLPVPPPRTPGDDDDEASPSQQWTSWLWGSNSRHHQQQQQGADSLAERGRRGSPIKRSSEREPSLEYSTAAGEMRSREGLPKVTRQCLIAEIKCYGKYMLPPIIVFLGLVMSLALVLYAHARSRQSDTDVHP